MRRLRRAVVVQKMRGDRRFERFGDGCIGTTDDRHDWEIGIELVLQTWIFIEQAGFVSS